MILVIELATVYVIKCRACSWHQIPKQGKPGASWTFNGNFENPTFSPSVNEASNPKEHKHYNPQIPTRRCHFTVKDGQITYHGDCTHTYRGTMPLEAWTEAEVAQHKEA